MYLKRSAHAYEDLEIFLLVFLLPRTRAHIDCGGPAIWSDKIIDSYMWEVLGEWVLGWLKSHSTT